MTGAMCLASARAELVPRVHQTGVELLNLINKSKDQNLDRITVSQKNDGTLLSTADLLSASSIRDAILNSTFKEDKIITEEDPEILAGQAYIPIEGKIWFIDPLDNTKAYLASRSDFSILMTRCDSGIAELAIIHYPAKGTTFLAVRGESAYVGEKKAEVSDVTKLSSARIAEVYTAEVNLGNTGEYPESTEAIVAVAAGELDIAFIRMCGHKIWDIAFSELLLSEAGGSVTDENGNVPVFHDLNAPSEWLIVSNSALHAEALSVLQKQLKK